MSAFFFAWLVDIVRSLPVITASVLSAAVFCLWASSDSRDWDGNLEPGSRAAGVAAKFLLALAFLAGVGAAALPSPATLEKFGAELTASSPQPSPALSGREAKPK